MKTLPYLLLTLAMTSCMHVSSKHMTLVGTDAENISYQTGGSATGGQPAVVFHADKINNSASMGQVVGLGNRAINWWGWSRIAKAVGNAVTDVSDNQSADKAASLAAGVKTKEIEANTAIELAKQAEAAKAAAGAVVP